MSTLAYRSLSGFATGIDRFLEKSSNYLGAVSVLLLTGGLAAAYMGNLASSRLIAGALVGIEVALVLSLVAGLRHRRVSRLLIFFNIAFMLVTTAALLANQRGWLADASNAIRQKIAEASKPPPNATRFYDR